MRKSGTEIKHNEIKQSEIKHREIKHTFQTYILGAILQIAGSFQDPTLRVFKMNYLSRLALDDGCV